MRVRLVSDMYARPDRVLSATFLHRQALEVTRIGVEVRVLSPVPAFPGRWPKKAHRRPHVERYELDGVPVMRARFPKPLPFGPAALLGGYLLERTLRRHVNDVRREFDFDLIYGIRLFPIVSSLVPIASEVGRPLLGSAMGSDVHTHPYRSRGIRRLTRRAIERSDQVAAVSRALGREVVALGEPRKPVRTIYNGVDTEQFAPPSGEISAAREALGLPRGGTGICTVCRVEREKGLQELAEAFRTVRHAYPEAWLVVVGDGAYRAKLEGWVESEGLGSRVFVVGAHPHDEIPRWLGAADVFVLAGHNEGLPNVVLEAMACGLPVVATDVGWTSEAVVHGRTGLLVPAADTGRLAGALDHLLGDEEERESMGRAGRHRAVDTFGWRESGETLVSLYREIVDEHNSHRHVAAEAKRGGA